MGGKTKVEKEEEFDKETGEQTKSEVEVEETKDEEE